MLFFYYSDTALMANLCESKYFFIRIILLIIIIHYELSNQFTVQIEVIGFYKFHVHKVAYIQLCIINGN